MCVHEGEVCVEGRRCVYLKGEVCVEGRRCVYMKGRCVLRAGDVCT